MSKQYLTTHIIDNAHPIDIYTLAVTPSQILSASGSSSIKIHSTTTSDFPIAQVLKDVHPLGCHHLATSQDGSKAISVGFGGEVKVWRYGEGMWVEDGELGGLSGDDDEGKKKKNGKKTKLKVGEMWAVALSEEGRFVAATSYDGRIGVWDLLTEQRRKIRQYETKGSFGLCVDMSADGRFTACGHESGNVYIFSNDTGRLLHSLPGLVKPVRAVAFSPGGKLLAAAGDARLIGLYDINSGEQVANLTGHGSWITSIDWSHTGEYLLSGSLDGKVKVWTVDQKMCVATHSETDKGLWSVKWLPKVGRNEGFATAGSNCSIAFYREASGG
ncbi:hypothetical protein GJ744_007370 [Endocarpon pusillum]|uniref:EML-like second beta-propeller domain-containing protein n=1 Tax=Endocarpon pusillum TaxID=364733 RepID=A0A8H7E466_9EURO|nr:hypothetical protein GJ744_007370 [Endocarpon pusillum]